MSNIYIQEPPTDGKVLLITSVGEIDIELWSKEAPRACRNFVQLCMEGYYNGTVFHRLIKDFIVQGGDPTGTGHGGESIYGKPFRDEFHSRLRFNRRGLAAMANAGPNDNGSQFFFTLGPGAELDRKHTIFGKVAGSTLYNMLKLTDVETDAEDRPLYPHKIHKTRVLHNPFEDIVPRLKEKDNQEGKKKKHKVKGTKNFSLLSFGEEAEEDEEEVKQVDRALKSKSKSSHDLLQDKRLSSKSAVHLEGGDDKHPQEQSEDDSDVDGESMDDELSPDKAQILERIKKKLKKGDPENEQEVGKSESSPQNSRKRTIDDSTGDSQAKQEKLSETPEGQMKKRKSRWDNPETTETTKESSEPMEKSSSDHSADEKGSKEKSPKDEGKRERSSSGDRGSHDHSRHASTEREKSSHQDYDSGDDQHSRGSRKHDNRRHSREKSSHEPSSDEKSTISRHSEEKYQRKKYTSDHEKSSSKDKSFRDERKPLKDEKKASYDDRKSSKDDRKSSKDERKSSKEKEKEKIYKDDENISRERWESSKDERKSSKERKSVHSKEKPRRSRDYNKDEPSPPEISVEKIPEEEMTSPEPHEDKSTRRKSKKHKRDRTLDSAEETEAESKRKHENNESMEEMESRENVVEKSSKESRREEREKRKKADSNKEVVDEDKEKQISKLDALKQEARALRRELMGKAKKKEEPVEVKKEKSSSDVLQAYEEERQKYMDRKVNRNKSSREQQTLAILAKFQNNLSAARNMCDYDNEEEEEAEEEGEEKEEEEDPNDLSWMNHKLKFDASRTNKVMDANVNDVDRYEIFDPRNPMTQRRREASKKAMEKK